MTLTWWLIRSIYAAYCSDFSLSASEYQLCEENILKHFLFSLRSGVISISKKYEEVFDDFSAEFIEPVLMEQRRPVRLGQIRAEYIQFAKARNVDSSSYAWVLP